MAICGRPDIGATPIRGITGYQARGPGRPKWAIYGRQDTGDIRTAGIVITTGIGARISVTTAASIMGMAILASDIKAGIGAGIVSITTVR